MAITHENLRKNRDKILEIARRHGAHEVRVFGSVARREATEASDIDILVRFEPERTLLDHAALIEELQDFLGMKVDVIDADGMRPRFKAIVEREALPL
jgi:predicted nucleotidyltransferase